MTVSLHTALPSQYSDLLSCDSRSRAKPARPAPQLLESDESELIKAAAQGCHDAFETLVVHHQDQIFQVCLRMLQRRDEAREVCQDVFLRAFRALPGFRPEAKLSTWLYQIALNRCRDHWKSNSGKVSSKSQAIGHSSLSLEAKTIRPDEFAEWSDEIEKFERSLLLLSPDHREIIILSCIQELSHAECGTILKCSTRAVEGRLRRAREALRQSWEKTE